METKTEKGLFLIKYKDNWYYNVNKVWYPFPLGGIDFHISSTNEIIKFTVPVDNISRKKARKVIKEFQKSITWFPNNTKFQIKINQYVRKEKLKKLMII